MRRRRRHARFGPRSRMLLRWQQSLAASPARFLPTHELRMPAQKALLSRTSPTNREWLPPLPIQCCPARRPLDAAHSRPSRKASWLANRTFRSSGVALDAFSQPVSQTLAVEDRLARGQRKPHEHEEQGRSDGKDHGAVSFHAAHDLIHEPPTHGARAVSPAARRPFGGVANRDQPRSVRACCGRVARAQQDRSWKASTIAGSRIGAMNRVGLAEKTERNRKKTFSPLFGSFGYSVHGERERDVSAVCH